MIWTKTWNAIRIGCTARKSSHVPGKRELLLLLVVEWGVHKTATKTREQKNGLRTSNNLWQPRDISSERSSGSRTQKQSQQQQAVPIDHLTSRHWSSTLLLPFRENSVLSFVVCGMPFVLCPPPPPPRTLAGWAHAELSDFPTTLWLCLWFVRGGLGFGFVDGSCVRLTVVRGWKSRPCPLRQNLRKTYQTTLYCC